MSHHPRTRSPVPCPGTLHVTSLRYSEHAGSTHTSPTVCTPSHPTHPRAGSEHRPPPKPPTPTCAPGEPPPPRLLKWFLVPLGGRWTSYRWSRPGGVPWRWASSVTCVGTVQVAALTGSFSLWVRARLCARIARQRPAGHRGPWRVRGRQWCAFWGVLQHGHPHGRSHGRCRWADSRVGFWLGWGDWPSQEGQWARPCCLPLAARWEVPPRAVRSLPFQPSRGPGAGRAAGER